MIFYSHCKINIGLRVTSKRNDGFHDIESLFYPVDGICDAIEIIEKDGSGIEFSSSGIAIDCASESNLCVKAYMLLKERYNIGAAKIHLHKNIPMGAGLGGGSANCAEVIKGLNQIFELGLDSQTMRSLGAELGSDVPFFIERQPSWVSGRGEIIEPAEISLKQMKLVIIKPQVHIGTAWAYSKITPNNTRKPLSEVLGQNISQWRCHVDNDFEQAVFDAHPQIGMIKQALYDSGAIFALMSGSGASVYGIFEKETQININLEAQDLVYQFII